MCHEYCTVFTISPSGNVPFVFSGYGVSFFWIFSVRFLRYWVNVDLKNTSLILLLVKRLDPEIKITFKVRKVRKQQIRLISEIVRLLMINIGAEEKSQAHFH